MQSHTVAGISVILIPHKKSLYNGLMMQVWIYTHRLFKVNFLYLRLVIFLWIFTFVLTNFVTFALSGWVLFRLYYKIRSTCAYNRMYYFCYIIHYIQGCSKPTPSWMSRYANWVLWHVPFKERNGLVSKSATLLYACFIQHGRSGIMILKSDTTCFILCK